MVFAALASSVHLDVNPHHQLSGSVAVSTLTPVFLALIWLPALLRLLTLAGGNVKTPIGEASTPGISRLFEPLDTQTKRDTLPVVLRALNSPAILTDPEHRTESRVARRELELQLAAVTPHAGGIREVLDRYASEYESLRETRPSGRSRTLEMSSLTAEVRAVARAMPPSTTDLRHMLENGSDGERVVALAIAQDRPDRRLLREICESIRESRSAFEQYQALGAAYEAIPLLDPSDRDALEDVLRQALADPDRGIADDPSRKQLVEAMLLELRP